MNPGLGLAAARARGAELRNQAATTAGTRRPRRRRRRASHRLGVVLIRVGWRLAGPEGRPALGAVSLPTSAS